MVDLEVYQYLLIALLFVWSGIVRSGFGFGGAVFALPFLLLIDNQPLVFLPIIAVHLLFFSLLTVYQNQRKKSAKLFLIMCLLLQQWIGCFCVVR